MRKLKNEELSRKSVEGFKNSDKTPVIIILDNIRSMNNVGSIFRTADAFLVKKIYLCGITGTPPHREIHKTALGSTETVDWEYDKNTLNVIAKLKADNYVIASVEQADLSVSLCDFMPEKDKNYALVFGNEVEGVNEQIINETDICLEIPQFGHKHSLNVAVSAAIVIWDISNKLMPLL